MVGPRVSMERMMELLESEPSVLVLPAESENLELSTEITVGGAVGAWSKAGGIYGAGFSAPVGERATGNRDIGCMEVGGCFRETEGRMRFRRLLKLRCLGQ